jgi:1-acyl-sn-glycerol-3-phosphate acyltransferase
MNKKTKFVVPQIYKAKRLFLFPLIGKFLQYLSGWKIEGTLPNINKIVVVCAPHTSNWDFIIGMMMVLSIDIRVNFLAKKSIFVPIFKIILNKLGGIPVDRENPELLVERIGDSAKNDKGFLIAVTPEGTRKKVTKWKTGFLRIAKISNSIIIPLGIDYPTKTFSLGEKFNPTGDNEKDVLALKFILKDFKGRHLDRH